MTEVEQKEADAIKLIAENYAKKDHYDAVVKDICDEMKDKYELVPAELKKLGQMLNKQNKEKEEKKAKALFDKYDSYFGEEE
jgi:hypothetical protein